MVLFGKVKNKGVIMKSLKILMLIALPLAVVLSGRAMGGDKPAVPDKCFLRK